MATQSELIRFLVLPLVVGFVGAILSAFISWVTERARMTREQRAMQIEKSVEVCTKIIDALDTLYALLNNDAWYVAWRKATEDKVKHPEELVARDKDRWASYQESLDNWRAHSIEYETELKGFFGNNGYEAFLFLSCAILIEEATESVWTVYYAPNIAPPGEPATPLFLRKGGKFYVEKNALNLSEAGQLKHMEEYFSVVDKLRERIASLSSTMIHCIQVMNVGSLAEAPEPVPEEDREEAEALLGGKVPRRYQSKKSDLTSAVKFAKLSKSGSTGEQAV